METEQHIYLVTEYASKGEIFGEKGLREGEEGEGEGGGKR